MLARCYRRKYWAYFRREVQSEGYSTSNTTFACPVGADNHVQIRTGPELDEVICNKVLELNAHN
jgi:hypothetical protein